jgi:hypothetical protein
MALEPSMCSGLTPAVFFEKTTAQLSEDEAEEFSCARGERPGEQERRGSELRSTAKIRAGESGFARRVSARRAMMSLDEWFISQRISMIVAGVGGWVPILRGCAGIA